MLAVLVLIRGGGRRIKSFRAALTTYGNHKVYCFFSFGWFIVTVF